MRTKPPPAPRVAAAPPCQFRRRRSLYAAPPPFRCRCRAAAPRWPRPPTCPARRRPANNLRRSVSLSSEEFAEESKPSQLFRWRSVRQASSCFRSACFPPEGHRPPVGAKPLAIHLKSKAAHRVLDGSGPASSQVLSLLRSRWTFARPARCLQGRSPLDLAGVEQIAERSRRRGSRLAAAPQPRRSAAEGTPSRRRGARAAARPLSSRGRCLSGRCVLDDPVPA